MSSWFHRNKCKLGIVGGAIAGFFLAAAVVGPQSILPFAGTISGASFYLFMGTLGGMLTGAATSC